MYYIKNNIPVASSSNSVVNNIAKLDSGASQHYFKSQHSNFLKKISTANATPILLPNNTTVHAKLKGTLSLHPSLSEKASTALIVPNLKNESLLSVGQIYDNNCKVTFSKDNVQITKNKKVIVTGNRNRNDGLWDIDLNNKTNHLNYMITKDKTKTELAQYLHAALFSPTITTLSKAIKRGNLITFPGIHEINFEKILKTTIATEKDTSIKRGKI